MEKAPAWGVHSAVAMGQAMVELWGAESALRRALERAQKKAPEKG